MSIMSFRCHGKGQVVTTRGVKPQLAFKHWTREWRISSSADKEKIISHLQELLECGSHEAEFLSQRAALVVDEMLENALYSAPRLENGVPLYDKTSARDVSGDEKIILRSAFDGEQLFLEISDNWGTLSPEVVEHYLTINSREDGHLTERAGRGLFILWKFLEYFYVHLNPGQETTMGGILSLRPDYSE